MQIWLRAKISEVIPPLMSSVFMTASLPPVFLCPSTWRDAPAVYLLSEVHTCTTLLPRRGKVSAAASVMNN